MDLDPSLSYSLLHLALYISTVRNRQVEVRQVPCLTVKMTFGSVRQCVCLFLWVWVCELDYLSCKSARLKKKSAKNACMANQSKVLQQERKAQKKRQAKDTKDTRKNTWHSEWWQKYKKKTETQNKWQLHKNNRNEKRSQEWHENLSTSSYLDTKVSESE